MEKNGRLNRTNIYGEGLSDRMVRACRTRCLTVLDQVVANGLIRVNPAVGCKLPPVLVGVLEEHHGKINSCWMLP